jgi:hypothetical protein
MGSESPAVLAERFYGRIERERILVAANLLEAGGGTTVVPGMRLEIPAVGHHVAGAGETWPSIAAARLGATTRGDVLARVNGANPWEPPAPGREIVVPFPLRYVASQGDTAESLAYRFLGRRDDAWMILSFNKGLKPRLAQGQIVLVPLTDLTLTEAGKAAARDALAMTTSEAGGRARGRQDAADRELEALVSKVRAGAYVDAIALGAGLLGQGELTVPQLARVHAALTEAYVAVAAKTLATESCKAWRKLEPDLELDPNRYSPKILAACAAGAP